jgi:hypothetical protein
MLCTTTPSTGSLFSSRTIPAIDATGTSVIRAGCEPGLRSRACRLGRTPRLIWRFGIKRLPPSGVEEQAELGRLLLPGYKSRLGNTQRILDTRHIRHLKIAAGVRESIAGRESKIGDSSACALPALVAELKTVPASTQRSGACAKPSRSPFGHKKPATKTAVSLHPPRTDMPQTIARLFHLRIKQE